MTVLAAAGARVGTRRRVKLGHVLVVVTAIVIGLVMLAPFAWMLSASLKLNKDVFTFPIQWIPTQPRWQNWTGHGWIRRPGCGPRGGMRRGRSPWLTSRKRHWT